MGFASVSALPVHVWPCLIDGLLVDNGSFVLLKFFNQKHR